MIKLIFTLLFIAGLGIADHFAVGRTKIYLHSQNAFFSSHVAQVDLDIAGSRKQGCRIDRILLIYAYQTCFVLEKNSGPAQGIGFDFVYHPPRPFFSIDRLISQSYYFGESALGERLKTLNKDMTVVYSKFQD